MQNCFWKVIGKNGKGGERRGIFLWRLNIWLQCRSSRFWVFLFWGGGSASPQPMIKIIPASHPLGIGDSLLHFEGYLNDLRLSHPSSCHHMLSWAILSWSMLSYANVNHPMWYCPILNYLVLSHVISRYRIASNLQLSHAILCYLRLSHLKLPDASLCYLMISCDFLCHLMRP